MQHKISIFIVIFYIFHMLPQPVSKPATALLTGFMPQYALWHSMTFCTKFLQVLTSSSLRYSVLTNLEVAARLHSVSPAEVTKRLWRPFLLQSVKERAQSRQKILWAMMPPPWYNAWRSVMGATDRQLLCAWHVDKSWRENIRKHIKDQQLQAFVYKVS